MEAQSIKGEILRELRRVDKARIDSGCRIVVFVPYTSDRKEAFFLDIAIKTYCKKFRKEEAVYINIADVVPFPNVCEDGDGSKECLECLKIAVEKHLQTLQE